MAVSVISLYFGSFFVIFIAEIREEKSFAVSIAASLLAQSITANSQGLSLRERNTAASIQSFDRVEKEPLPKRAHIKVFDKNSSSPFGAELE